MDSFNSTTELATQTELFTFTDAYTVATPKDVLANWSNRNPPYILRIRDIIAAYVAPVIVILGVIGNSLSMATLMSPQMRHSHSNVLLFLLSLVDTAYLLTGPVRGWFEDIVGIDFRKTGRYGCKIFNFVNYTLLHLASGTLALMTIERVIAVCLPLKVKQLCTKRRVVGAWLILVLICALFNTHFFVTTDFAVIIKVYQCRFLQKYRGFEFNIWYWIDGTMTFLMPFSVIVTGNCIIISKLAAARAKRSRELKVGGPQGKSGVSSTTVTLLLITSVYFILMLPRAVVFIGMRYALINMYTFDGYFHFLFARMLTEKLANLNNAINFVLYCLSGPKFRRALLATVCRIKIQPKKRPAASSDTGTTMTSVATVSKDVNNGV